MLHLWFKQIKGRVANYEGLQRLFAKVRRVDRVGVERTVLVPFEEIAWREGLICSCGDTPRGCAIGGCYARAHEQGLFDPERRVRVMRDKEDYARRMAEARAKHRNLSPYM